jgi:hypothetical protein
MPHEDGGESRVAAETQRETPPGHRKGTVSLSPLSPPLSLPLSPRSAMFHFFISVPFLDPGRRHCEEMGRGDEADRVGAHTRGRETPKPLRLLD